MPNFPLKEKRRVVVIGAGAAGLCAARHLASEPRRFAVDVFEQQGGVGGTWRYSEAVGLDEHGLPVHSSMYKNLRTNLPKEIMAFPDFPFRNGDRSFVHHSEILSYLEDYAKHFSLFQHIKFHHFVLDVKPHKVHGETEWIVTVRDLQSRTTLTKTYDAVMVCNGHYSVPYIPKSLDVSKFKGTVIHSHDYRDPTSFTDLKVVVLGAGASGVDIALEISSVAKQVILSHNKPPLTCPLPEKLTQRAGIESCEEDRVRFPGGETYLCDALVLCTGYEYVYPFLHEVQISEQRVSPLFLHLFLASDPTLAIWGVPKLILPFPIYNQQVKVFLKFLEGLVDLPSEESMRRDAEEDFRLRMERGLGPRQAHLMAGQLQWLYDDELSRLGKIDPLPDSTRKLFQHIHSLRGKDIIHYKNANFAILDDGSFLEL